APPRLLQERRKPRAFRSAEQTTKSSRLPPLLHGAVVSSMKKGRQCRPFPFPRTGDQPARVPRRPAYAPCPLLRFGPAWAGAPLRAPGLPCARCAGLPPGRGAPWRRPPPFFGIGASSRIGVLGA